ncbi:hypothetical protein M3Y99_00080100 [Aphelenchoides fujianensis]|nr:hypothetical protein M3Y99_00080100 [Aphelenchoides fujianensis]
MPPAFRRPSSGRWRESCTQRFANTEGENMKLLLETSGQPKLRKLDAKKRTQLNALYFETFCSIVNDLELAEHKIEFVKLEVPPTLSEIAVFWRATGTERDAEIEQLLERNPSQIMTIRLGNRLPSFFRLSEEVRAALGGGKPVVALESTVITHGLPFPENLKVAESLEAVVRENGATPATIALMGGRVHVGLDGRQLEELADVSQETAESVHSRSPQLFKAVGGTTVAATMKIASMAGIRVFATGGIGGVHRGAKCDADLVELSRTPVAVVCAGAKSILDVPKTLELLETLGVNVITFDKEAFFPGFFTRFSALKSPFNTDDVKTVAEILKLTDELEHKGGTLIAAPLPVGFEQQSERVEEAVNRAIEEADEQKMAAGSHVALLKNNAKIASEIASEYSRLQTPPAIVSPPPATAERRKEASGERKFEVVFA